MHTEINLTKINRIVEELRRCEENLKRQYYEITGAITILKRIDEQGIQISCRKLAGQKSTLYEEIRKVQALRAALEKIMQLYQKNERTIADYDTSSNAGWKLIGHIPTGFYIMNPYLQALDKAMVRFE